jgi:diguanylate cyclase (GGDEF)-like protein
MPDFQTVQLSDSGQGLFSGAEVQVLMRVEFERARRHKFPLVCMRVAVDRIDQLHDLYGVESKDEILRSVTTLMRESMRDSDHLGMTQDDRFLAIFPHTTPETGQLLAKRLLANARKLRFERDGRSLRISLSIGIAHNKDEAANAFETLLAVANDGLDVADAGGGDRFVETELYALYANKKKRAGGPEVDKPLIINPPAKPAPAPAPAPATREDRISKSLLEKLQAQGFDIEALVNLPPDAIARAIRAIADQKAAVESGADADKTRQIDLLERRIAKLTHVLGVTEDELRRVALMKGIDDGVASIYSTVQGLAADAANYERKREMMKTIFEANFELKQKLGPGPGSPTEKK